MFNRLSYPFKFARIYALSSLDIFKKNNMTYQTNFCYFLSHSAKKIKLYF